jgi:DNA-directed RNA polymerase subunit omega
VHDELKEEGIVNKVGGRFKLSTLIQKRMVMLNQGYKPLVEVPRGADRMAIVLREILEDKIYLDASNAVQYGANPNDLARRANLGDISGDLSLGGDD